MVYIRRGVLGGRELRALVNGSEVERFLVSHGVKIVDPDNLSSEQIARELMGAKVIFSTEGSHISHAIYAMADDAVLFVFQPPGRFNNVYKEYTDCFDMRYAFVVGNATEGGFTVNTDDVARTLACVEKQVRL